MTIILQRDIEHEGFNKLPRQGRWGWHGGDIIYRCTCMNAPLLNAHSIAEDGTVSPSVVCTTNLCGFHEFVKLEGWTAEDHVEKNHRTLNP